MLLGCKLSAAPHKYLTGLPSHIPKCFYHYIVQSVILRAMILRLSCVDDTSTNSAYCNLRNGKKIWSQRTAFWLLFIFINFQCIFLEHCALHFPSHAKLRSSLFQTSQEKRNLKISKHSFDTITSNKLTSIQKFSNHAAHQPSTSCFHYINTAKAGVLSGVGFEPTPTRVDCDLNAAPSTARPSWLAHD